ncbi:hypothetical protein DXU03_26090 [Rhizobium johnstonii]
MPIDPGLLEAYARLRSRKLCDAAYIFGKMCAGRGVERAENPHSLDEREPRTAWDGGWIEHMRREVTE